MRPERLLGLVLSLGAFAACSFDWDTFDPRLGGGATTSAGAMGGAPAGGGGAGAAGGNAGGAGGSGGIGGDGGSGGQPVLVDRGLLTRYFIDEAASGTTPTVLDDVAPNPLALTLDYGVTSGTGGAGGGSGVPNMTFTETAGQRGLTWAIKEGPGAATGAISGKLSALNGATEGSIECVADVVDSDNINGICPRMSQLGVLANGSFTLCTSSLTNVSFKLNGNTVEDWTVDLLAVGRSVFTLVFDSNLAPAADRVRLYVDGVDQGDDPSAPPAQGTAIDLTTGEYILGNRGSGTGSFEGSLYYCALYSVALTAQEVAQNAAILAVNDDAPN